MRLTVRTHYPSYLVAIAWLLTSCATQTFPVGQPCLADGYAVIDGFVAARRGVCSVEPDGQVSLEITPESAGKINPSPWYAFRIAPQGAKSATLTLRYAGTVHRYPPKVSTDGVNWDRLDDSFVAILEDGVAAEITVPLGDGEVWVAAQEIVPPQLYREWGEKIARDTGFAPAVLGRSVQGRDIHVFDTDPDLREVVLLTGRQHPPEVSGAFAFFDFAETVLGTSELAARFRERFRVIAIPMLNPDGVAAGNWRHNVNDADLNRDWGPFQQPETMLIADLLDELDGEGSHIRIFIDFHSTNENVFYTQHEETNPPGFTAHWLWRAAVDIEDYSFRVGDAPVKQLNASKNYMFVRYGIPSITYEVGDETDRDAARSAARIFAEELMRQMLDNNFMPSS